MSLLKTTLKQKTLFLLLIIMAIAIFFRFFDLTAVPPGLYPDAAINGNDALTALETNNFKLFYPENNGREGLFINLIAFSFWLFGPSIWAIKIVSAIFGLLTVLGLYLLTRQLFTRLHPKTANNIALLSTFFLAISFWHVNFSRLGFRAIMVPFFLVWSFYFLFKLIYHLENSLHVSHIKVLFFSLLGGFLFGLGFHTYIAFRIAPLILIPISLFAIINYWRAFKIYREHKLTVKESFVQSYLRDGWFGWDLFFAAVVLAALPMILYFWQHPVDFVGRTGQVSVMSSVQPIKEFAISAAKTVGQFVAIGDYNARHNQPGSPQIFWPLIPSFILGLGYSIGQVFKTANWRQKDFNSLQAHFTLLFWWGAMLAPSILTTEGLPHSLRSIGAIPPSYIFVGLGSYFIIKFFQAVVKKPILLKTLSVFLFLGLTSLIFMEFWRYFIAWGQNPETRSAFTQIYVDQANYLNSLPSEAKKYVFVNEGGVPVPYPNGLPMPTQTLIFLTNRKSDIKYLIPDNCESCQIGQEEATANLLNIEKEEKIVFLPLRYDENLFNEFKKYYPAGQIEKINNFSVFKINF